VGPYTAAAIASMAFDIPAAVVDGNVFRVLARVFGIDTDIAGNEGKKQFASLANELLPHQQPGDYNQALMEFGALQCTPQTPDCAACPLRASCVAFATQRVSLLPVKEKKVKVRVRHLNYFVLTHGGKVAMQPRSGADIWKGLYDFYLVETPRHAKAEELLAADSQLRALNVRLRPEAAEQVRHQLTHQQLHICFIACDADREALPPGLQWYSPRQWQRLPKPIAITRYLEGKTEVPAK
jgi:A/G-specific adenine glycosylase